MSPFTAQQALLSLSLSPANAGASANAAAAIKAVNFFMTRSYDSESALSFKLLTAAGTHYPRPFSRLIGRNVKNAERENKNLCGDAHNERMCYDDICGHNGRSLHRKT